MKWYNLRTTLITIGVGMLFLLLGTAVYISAQPGQNKKNNKQQPQQQQQQDLNKYRIPKQRQPVQRKQMPGMWQQHRAGNWQNDHRSWQQRGGYDGYRIPQTRYNRYFGNRHGFRLSRRSMALVDGRPHFQYGGYWFGLMDPWPENWSANWYQNDDVYVEYSNDGYYLFNRRHPGIGLSLNVSIE